MIGAPPTPPTQTTRTPKSPAHTPAPSPQRPPLSKPSAATPKRKRRRPPPPLSVTSVFTQHRLPTNASELWQWPVTSWYLGDVGPNDLKLATNQPFLDHHALATAQEAKTPPNHYRLRWLHHDAKRIVNPNRPDANPVLDPFETLPYAGKKDSGACERPMPGVKRHLEDPDDPVVPPSRGRRKAKRACTASRSHPPTTPDLKIHARPVADMPVAFDAVVPNRHANPTSQKEPVGMPALRTGNDNLPHGDRRIEVDADLSVDEKGTMTLPDCAPAPEPRQPLQSPVNSVDPSLQVLSNRPHVNADQLLEIHKLQNNQPLNHNDSDHPGTSTNTQVDAPSSDAPKKNIVNLQFQSPHEPRLMGSITYSVAMPPLNDAVHKPLNEEGRCVEGTNHRMEAELLPDSFDLQFRKADHDFLAGFDDRDLADELRSEIRRRSNMLQPLDERAAPLRAAMFDALQNEIQRQTESADLVAEGDRLLARLKEIQQQKKAARQAARQAAKEVATSNRRTSERKRPSSRMDDTPVAEENGRRSRSRSRRPLRPSRKVIDDIDFDDNDGDEEPEAARTIPDLTPSPRSRDTGAQLHDKCAQSDTSAVEAEAALVEKACESAETVAKTTQGRCNGAKSTGQAEGEANAERGASMASSPSDDGTEMGVMASPCGLFPGESEDAGQVGCMASPLSPLKVGSPGAKNGNYPQLKIALRLGAGPK